MVGFGCVGGGGQWVQAGFGGRVDGVYGVVGDVE